MLAMLLLPLLIARSIVTCLAAFCYGARARFPYIDISEMSLGREPAGAELCLCESIARGLYGYVRLLPSSLLMDAPKHDAMGELAELAQDRKSWQATKHAIDSRKQCSNPQISTRQPEPRLD